MQDNKEVANNSITDENNLSNEKENVTVNNSNILRNNLFSSTASHTSQSSNDLDHSLKSGQTDVEISSPQKQGISNNINNWCSRIILSTGYHTRKSINVKMRNRQRGSAPDDELEEELIRKDHQYEVAMNCVASPN